MNFIPARPRTVRAALLSIGAVLTAALAIAGLDPVGNADAATSLSTPYCTNWKESGNHASKYRYCATFSKKSTAFSATDQYQLQNTDPKKVATLNCDVRKAHTWKESGTVSVKAEAGVVFAKAETQVSGSLEHSTSAEVGSGIDYAVSPHSWGHCRYGSAMLTVWGTAYEEINNGRIRRTAVHSFKTTFPSVATWVVGPGQL